MNKILPYSVIRARFAEPQRLKPKSTLIQVQSEGGHWPKPDPVRSWFLKTLIGRGVQYEFFDKLPRKLYFGLVKQLTQPPLVKPGERPTSKGVTSQDLGDLSQQLHGLSNANHLYIDLEIVPSLLVLGRAGYKTHECCAGVNMDVQKKPGSTLVRAVKFFPRSSSFDDESTYYITHVKLFSQQCPSNIAVYLDSDGAKELAKSAEKLARGGRYSSRIKIEVKTNPFDFGNQKLMSVNTYNGVELLNEFVSELVTGKCK